MHVLSKPSPAEGAVRSRQPEHPAVGIEQEQIWATPESVAGLLTVNAGRRAMFGKPRLHHHIWVLDGEADLLGSTLTSGSYTHVEPGVPHELDASATFGCTVFHVFERDGVRVSAVDHEGSRNVSG